MVEDGFGKKGNVDEMKRVRRGGGSIVLSSTTTMADPRERCGLEKGVVGKATAVVATGGDNRNSKRRERYSQYWGPLEDHADVDNTKSHAETDRNAVSN